MVEDRTPLMDVYTTHADKQQKRTFLRVEKILFFKEQRFSVDLLFTTRLFLHKKTNFLTHKKVCFLC